MKTYAIIAKTNGYIAARDIEFNGKERICVKANLTLKQAQEELLHMFNKAYASEKAFCANWGVARRVAKHTTTTFANGTRSFEYDSRYYCIEEQTKELEALFNL